ncbi:MAG: MMPL family transporter, partial [Gammaproteobacteria bacterium]|nr:MMPL family transporter [Gammaproteobacteria bacterium]
DRQLGGTTPLDVIIDAPAAFLEFTEDEFEDEYELKQAQSAGITSTSYWFNTFQLEQVFALHDYLDNLPETGKVLSIATSMKMLEQIDKQVAKDDFLLAVFHKKLPDDIKQALFQPYMSADGNQIRFAIRVFESDPSLQREALLEKIQSKLTTEFNIEPERVHLSGMLVLYNNMLQSLFRSQILTIGVVFFAILIMFAILFRNLKMAGVAVIPNLFAASLVLGLMGWLKIPLDIMTITIAAISIGIAVDDTIHYVHRFTEEFARDQDYWAAVRRSHASIGRAMYYTTVTITLGFSILALSNFVPTIYFGLLTGFAMLIALLADLTLLPLLIVLFKPIRQV